MWLLIIPLVSSKFSFVLLYVRWRCQHDFHIISCSCGLIVKRWVLQVEYDLLGFLDHMSSLPGFWCCSIFGFLYLFLHHCLSFVLFWPLYCMTFFDLRGTDNTMAKRKMTNNDLQNIHITLKIKNNTHMDLMSLLIAITLENNPSGSILNEISDLHWYHQIHEI